MKNGPYVLVIAPIDYPGKKYRGRYIYEHHLIWWSNTGEIIAGTENIHHKNKNKTDNRFENLQKLTSFEHSSLHGLETSLLVKSKLNATCSNCKKKFHVRPYKLKQKYIFCSRKCIGLFGFNKKIFHSSSVGS